MNVIDSLVIELGLNSKDFVEGVKGSTDALEGFATKALGIFGLSLGLESMVGYFKDIHQQLAGVGYESRNLGVASTELMRYGEVSQLMGGQAQDAISSVQGLQAALFNLQYHGQISDQLIMLQRFGVAYETASGHMRNFKDIAHDAAATIDTQGKANGLDQGQKYQMALSMGFTGGIASAVSQGGKGLETALAESAADQKTLSNDIVKGQMKLSQDLTRLDYSTTANSAAILNQLTPQIEAAVKELTKLADTMLPKVVDGITDVQNFFKNPPPWFKTLEGDFEALEKTLGPAGTLATALGAGGVLVGAVSGLTKALLGAPLGLLRGVTGRTAAGTVEEVAAGAGGAGLMATVGGALSVITAGLLAGWGADLIPVGHGQNVGDKLSEMWGEIFDSWQKALQDQHNAGLGAGLGLPSLVFGGAIVTPKLPLISAPPTPNAVRPTAPSATGPNGAPAAKAGTVNNVSIDSISISTRATDAYRMASDMNDAIARKFLVANSDAALA